MKKKVEMWSDEIMSEKQRTGSEIYGPRTGGYKKKPILVCYNESPEVAKAKEKYKEMLVDSKENARRHIDNRMKSKPRMPTSGHMQAPRAVIQCEMDYKFLAIHHSIKDAADKLAINQSRIISCCKGRQIKNGKEEKVLSAGGYRWFYLTKPPAIFYSVNNPVVVKQIEKFKKENNLIEHKLNP